MTRRLVGFALATLLAYVLGAIAATQAVLLELGRMGIDVTLATRVDTTLADVSGMASSYLPLIAIAFAVALPVAAWVIRRMPALQVFGYSLAGAVAIAALHLIMKEVLDITAVAAVRQPAGLLGQMVAGALGGLAFARLVREPAAPRA